MLKAEPEECLLRSQKRKGNQRKRAEGGPRAEASEKPRRDRRGSRSADEVVGELGRGREALRQLVTWKPLLTYSFKNIC